MGTWNIGDRPGRRGEEIRSLQRGIDLGMGLIDTAEMYGDGAAEKRVGEAIAGRREQVFLVSKLYPHNATRTGTIAACERSLARLGTDRIDLYLLHWRGNVPFSETIGAFERLQREGKIRHWGVSNLDPADLAELYSSPGGTRVATNQVLYNLGRRGVEFALLPWLRERGIPTMAYSPIGQSRLLESNKVKAVARDVGLSPAQLAIAWLLQQPDIVVIPKRTHVARLAENLSALELQLDAATIAALNATLPAPTRPTPLAML